MSLEEEKKNRSLLGAAVNLSLSLSLSSSASLSLFLAFSLVVISNKDNSTFQRCFRLLLDLLFSFNSFSLASDPTKEESTIRSNFSVIIRRDTSA